MPDQPAPAFLVVEQPDTVTDPDLRLLENLIGRSVVVRGVEYRRTDLSWLALVALPLTGFLQTFGEEAAKGLLDAVRTMTKRASRPADAPDAVALRDTATTTLIVLEPDLPAAAYDELRLIDAAAAYAAPLRFNRSTGRWEPRR